MFHQLMKKGTVFRPLSEFETLLTMIGRPKLLSRFYAILSRNVIAVERDKFRWEQDPKIHWIDEEWRAICRFNQACSRNVLLQENWFRILHKWYLTPQRIKRKNSSTDAKCW